MLCWEVGKLGVGCWWGLVRGGVGGRCGTLDMRGTQLKGQGEGGSKAKTGGIFSIGNQNLPSLSSHTGNHTLLTVLHWSRENPTENDLFIAGDGVANYL